MGNINIFENMAHKYDTVERIEASKMIAEELRQHIIAGKEKTAIDYGCGTGLVGLQLLGDFDSVTFADASENMIQVVEAKIEQGQITNGATICLDLETAFQPNISADYIFLVQVLLHIKEITPLLEKLYQMLNEAGHLIIVDFDYETSVVSDKVHSGFQQEQLLQVMEEIGFGHSESKTFYHGKNIFMNQDASMFILEAVKTVDDKIKAK